MKDNSVSSNGFPGRFAGAVPVGANSAPSPPPLATETVPRLSPRQRLLAALTGLLPRNLPASNPPSGRTNSSSSYKGAGRALGVTALLALLAASLLFLLPGGPLHAQEAAISYPENGADPVATYTAVDPEGESIVWSLADGGDVEHFSIGENGVLTFKNSPDFEAPQGGDAGDSNTYVVTVRASDGGEGTTATKVVMIEVTNVEEPGTVTLSTLQPQVSVGITATLTDPDNAIETAVTWQWYRGNSEIVGATDGAGMLMSSYTPTTGDIGSVLRATAMYDDGEDADKTAQEDSAHAVRLAPESNIPPTFPDQDLVMPEVQTEQTREVAENTPAGTNIGAPVVASDPDVLTYSLDVMGAMSFDINRATGQLITKVALNFEGSPPDTATVTATDPFGATVMSIVTITVTDVNEAPMVTGDASIDHAESNEDTVAVLGVEPRDYTGSDVDATDPAADLTWTLSGADASKFSIPETGATRILSFKANPDYESPGDSGGDNVYEVTLVVTDSKGNTDEQDVTVKVMNIEEDGVVTLSTLQPRVGFPVTATLADPDNVTEGSVSWQWYDGAITENELEVNVIEGATSATYIPVAGDVDVNDTLWARAAYTDGNANEGDAKDVATVKAENSVLVDTRNKAPVFPDQDDEMEGRQTAQERTVAENTASGMDIGDVVIAEDEDTNLTYSLGGPNAASFDIVRDTGQLQTKAGLDKETKDIYTVTVTAVDSLSVSSTITVTINVTNVDEMPDLEGAAPEEYAENGTRAVATFTAKDPEGESIVWSLTGNDMEDFSIVNGMLRFKSSPDYEAPADADTDNMYEVTVQASDGGVDTTATEEVTIEVTNVDEPGTVTLSTLQPQVARVIMATLDDPDNEIANTVTWQWYRGSSPITGANNGESSNTSMYTPAAGDVGSKLRARAMYRDDEDEDKTAQENSANSVRRAPDTSNTDPVFPDQDLNEPFVQTAQTREVAENTRTGTNLGARIAARDPGDVLTYSLDNSEDNSEDAAAFDINRATGQLTTKEALNHETKETYRVTVTATDPFGAPVTSMVTITVTDVNEDPSVSGAASIDHAENGTELDIDAEADNVQPADYTATDEDDADNAETGLTWLLSGADASKFNITTSGDMRTLSFKANPDYESPGDSGRNNVYEVTVKVTDSKGNSDEQDVTVKVTNEEEPGTVTLSTLQPRVDFPMTATLADADNITADSISWQWYKGTVTQNQLATLDGKECEEADSNDCFIKGATSATYTPVAGDVNGTVVVVALYTDGSPNEADAPKDFAMMVTAQQVLADTRNKAPVFPDQDDEMDGDQTDQERSVMENTASDTPIGSGDDGPVIAMDFIIAPDDGEETPEVLTYTLGGPDAASFTIDRATAHLSTKAALDYETKDTYTVMVTATDPSGETATVMVTINVMDEDEAPEIMRAPDANVAPEFADSEDGARSVAENTVAGEDIGNPVAAADANGDTLAYTLGGTDAASFDIDRTTGQLRTKASLDFETKSGYTVMVTATDPRNLTATATVTITVTNVDEGFKGSGLPAVDYAENGTVAVATYSATDPESATIIWSLEGDDAADFGISTGGVLTFGSPPDYENPADADPDNVYEVTVKASDGTNEDTLDVTVTVTDVDEGFEVSGLPAVDYAENGTVAVATYSATDPESATIIWSLEGDDAADFGISTGGVLTFGSPPDYENPADADPDNVYEVTVKASDGTNEDTLDVTVTVTDVDEGFEVSGLPAVDYAENGTVAVATYSATDPESATIIWSLEGDDAAGFEISTGGVLTFKSSPDYEDAADDDTNNAYELRVVASDATNDGGLDVTVTVTDVVDEDVAPADPVGRYDKNNNGRIDKDELVDGVFDYNVEQTLSKSELVELILSYEIG